MGYFRNGTEGMDYEERYCDKCKNRRKDDYCPVWSVHSLFNYAQHKDPTVMHILDILIPRTKDRLSNEQCKMFHELPKEA